MNIRVFTSKTLIKNGKIAIFVPKLLPKAQFGPWPALHVKCHSYPRSLLYLLVKLHSISKRLEESKKIGVTMRGG